MNEKCLYARYLMSVYALGSEGEREKYSIGNNDAKQKRDKWEHAEDRVHTSAAGNVVLMLNGRPGLVKLILEGESCPPGSFLKRTVLIKMSERIAVA